MRLLPLAAAALVLATVVPVGPASAAATRDGGLRSRRRVEARAREDGGDDAEEPKDLGYMAQVLVHQRGRFRSRPVSKRAVPVPPVDPMESSGGVMPIHPGIDPELVRSMYNGDGGSLLQSGAAPREGPSSDKETEDTIVQERAGAVTEDSADVIDAIRRGLPRPHGLWTRFKALRGTPMPPVDPQSYSGGVRQLTMADIRPFRTTKKGFAMPMGLLQAEARTGSGGARRVSVTGREERPSGHAGHGRRHRHHQRRQASAEAPPGERLQAWGVEGLPDPIDSPRPGAGRRAAGEDGGQAAGEDGATASMRFAQTRGIGGGFGGRADPADAPVAASAVAQSVQAPASPPFQAPTPPQAQPPAAAPASDPYSSTNLPSDAAYQSFRSVLDLGISSPIPPEALRAFSQGAQASQAPSLGVASDLASSTASGLAGLSLPQGLMRGVASLAALAGTPQQQQQAGQQQQPFPQQAGQQPQPFPQQAGQQPQPYPQQAGQQPMRFSAPQAPLAFPPQASLTQQRMRGFAAQGPPQGPPSAYHRLRAAGSAPAMGGGQGAPQGGWGDAPRPPLLVGSGATPGGLPMGSAGPMDMRAAASGDGLRGQEAPPSAYRPGVAPAGARDQGTRFRESRAAAEQAGLGESAPAGAGGAAEAAAPPSAREVMDQALDLGSAASLRGFRDALSDIGFGAGSTSPSV